jgi:hypothetical protein
MDQGLGARQMTEAALRHPFVAKLRGHVIADLEDEITLACQVGTLAAAGYRKGEIARLTKATPAQLRNAYARLRRVAPNIELPEA